MALLTGILGPDHLRAGHFLKSASKLAPALPWLRHTDTRMGRLSISLDAAPKTPYTTFQDSRGQAVFLLGDILPKSSTATETVDATWLNEQCNQRGPEILGQQNGYYLAGMADQHDAIYVAADQLGLMPVYYWAGPDHFCFSTSPNAFLSHPDFSAVPDLMGIAGILLIQHATGNRTTWRDVHRLPPGHMLRWRAGEQVRLSEVNPLKAHDSYFGWPQSRCQSLIQNNFNEAVQRLDKLGETSVMLSGGLDSRLVAGCLRWYARYKVPVITLGESTDYEMQCARGVAKSLGWPIYPVPVDFDTYPSWAQIQVRLEGMQSTFGEFMFWQAIATANKLKPRIMTGLLGDPVMGGSLIDRDIDNESGLHTYAAQFARCNRYGYSAAVISRLTGHAGLGEEVASELQKTWTSYDGLPFQKCWLFDLQHRLRLHVGAIAGRFSFGAWPTCPYTDMTLLHTIAGMAAPAFAERRAQVNMLCNKFPKLAALPLDRGGPDIHPLAPQPMWRLKHYLRNFSSELGLRTGHVEKRQYVRHFDVNSPGWLAIRRLAEQHRTNTFSLFNPVVLEEMMASSDATLLTPDAVVDGARYKTLLGIFLQMGASTKSPLH